VQLRIIKPSLGRLKELTVELGQDFSRWKEKASPLLPGERRAYLNVVQ